MKEENLDLKRELGSQKKVISDQSKALEKIESDNEFPQRMKMLIDELRMEKDKFSKLKDQYRTLDKSSRI